MRIAVMDAVFGIEGLGEIVKNYLVNPENKDVPIRDPESPHISVATVVDAYYSAHKEAGLERLFTECTARLPHSEDEKRQRQLSEGAVRVLKVLQSAAEKDKAREDLQLSFSKAKHAFDALRQQSRLCDQVYRQVFPEIGIEKEKIVLAEDVKNSAVVSVRPITREFVEIPEAELWLQGQNRLLSEIASFCESDQFPKYLEEQSEKAGFFTKAYERKNAITKIDATTRFANKTLYGAPSDQNRLGKIGEQEVTKANGTKVVQPLFAENFEDFYIAGSEIKLAHRIYDLMQAPLVAHKDKSGTELVDTVGDFWNTVVVLRKSPVIVTTHDPEEKIPTRGYAERADYWSHDRFKTAMELKNGWRLTRTGDDTVVAISRHSKDIRLVKRHFTALHAASGSEHRVTQLQYQGWPDHLGAPDHELLVKASDEVEKEYRERKLDHRAPVTVHCAAGMGRSPTFIAVNHLALQMEEQLQKGCSLDEIRLNIAATVYAIKKQRPSTLGGKDHWRTIHFAVRRLYLASKEVAGERLYSLEQATEEEIIRDGLLVLKHGHTEYKKLKEKDSSPAIAPK